jgi:hypothetical protein
VHPNIPQFNSTKHLTVFRGVDRHKKDSQGGYVWGGSCPACSKDVVHPDTNITSTGMHWSTTGSGGYLEDQDLRTQDSRLYEGFTDKKNVLSRKDIDQAPYDRHGIVHLEGEPEKNGQPFGNESETPLKYGSIVHITKTTHLIRSDANPGGYPIVVTHATPIPMVVQPKSF